MEVSLSLILLYFSSSIFFLNHPNIIIFTNSNKLNQSGMDMFGGGGGGGDY
jgi:hypothetical protein